MYKLDTAKRDGLTAFLIRQLTALDMRLNEPLMGETEWPKLLKMRTNVSLGDDATAFFRQAWTANGQKGNGISWAGRRANGTVPTVGIGDEMVTTPLRPWAQALDYTVFELESAQKLGRNISDEKLRIINKKYQLDVDQIVTLGDDTMRFKGLFNSNQVTAANVANGAGGTPAWSTKTPLEIVKDVNDKCAAIYKASGFSHAPDTLVLPNEQWELIATTPMSATIPDITILDWLQRRSFSTKKNGRELTILDSKYLEGQGVGSTDRMVLYTNAEDIVRIAGTPLTTMPVQVHDYTMGTTVYGVIGEVEIVYPTTIGYADGI